MPGTRARRALLRAACALVLAALAACGSSGSSGGTASSSTSAAAAGSGSAAAALVTIQDFAFTTPSSVSPGARVTVHNMDGTAHTVTADSGSAFDDQAAPGNSSFTAPTQPGSYPFHCTIHPEMHGVLVVA